LLVVYRSGMAFSLDVAPLAMRCNVKRKDKK
jgi:hypothetical protein